ncbi:MAG: hypothetical protein GVY08_02465 [Bacteroidetes bacterium]|jgi:hypothetical protein|nr:hypothetical protein [Bacteroidota bacterium]
MISRLLYLNWKLFLARLSRLQAALLIGYTLFLVGMFINIMGTAVVIIFLDSTTTRFEMNLPWLTPEMHQLLLLTFANVFWFIHFSFTNTRLLNVDENRKLLAFAYPAHQLARHLNILSLFHPVNMIYNLTWLVFLGLQINSGIHIPVLIAALILNYGVIYSIKQRFLQLVERRFRCFCYFQRSGSRFGTARHPAFANYVGAFLAARRLALPLGQRHTNSGNGIRFTFRYASTDVVYFY